MISVVMTVYNGETYLASAIESILNQTYKDFEFIIVNDGSTDHSVSIIQHYQEQDPRIRFIELGENKGRCYALNRGVEEARYNWIANMDCDDIALPHRLERQLAATREDEEVIVWGSYVSHINSHNEVLSINKVGPTTREEMNQRMTNAHPVFVMHCVALMRKDIIQTVGGYDPDFVPAEDLELFARMVKHGPILAIPEVLCLYRIHESSLSMTKLFQQKMLTHYVELMYQCDNTGEPLPSLQEFITTREKQPLFRRMRQHALMLRALYYRRAGMAYGERRWLQAAILFAASSILDPTYSIPRAWRQVFCSRGLRRRIMANSE